MLKNVSRMQDLTIHASDGEIGHVEEFYFDDETWTIRYLVVNTGNWLSGRGVLISPISLLKTDWEKAELYVALTKTQIENSPDIDTHKPVSRQHEEAYFGYFGYPYYWNGFYGQPVSSVMLPLPVNTSREQPPTESHLRSTAAVKGYHIKAADGEIGHVDDFIVDLETWNIRYLDVSTRNWLPGKKVLISQALVGKIDWATSTISVELPLETIRSAPEYVESRGITHEYERQLYEYYGGPIHWSQELEGERAHRAGTRFEPESRTSALEDESQS